MIYRLLPLLLLKSDIQCITENRSVYNWTLKHIICINVFQTTNKQTFVRFLNRPVRNRTSIHNAEDCMEWIDFLKIDLVRDILRWKILNNGVRPPIPISSESLKIGIRMKTSVMDSIHRIKSFWQVLKSVKDVLWFFKSLKERFIFPYDTHAWESNVPRNKNKIRNLPPEDKFGLNYQR